MRTNPFKSIAPVIKALLLLAVALAVIIPSCALINERLDEQHKAQERYIQAYQQELKQQQVKE